MAKKTAKRSRFEESKSIIRNVFIVAFGIYLSFFTFEFSKNYTIEIKSKNASETEIPTSIDQSTNVTKPKYWFYMTNGYMWIFFSIENVLQKLGLEKIEVELKYNETVHNNWNLVWSYDYLNEIPLDYQNMDYHQKVNHIPGNFVLTMKEHLAIQTDSKFIPKGFNNSESLKNYSLTHPDTRYVQKLWSNRGVELKTVDEMNFDFFGRGYKHFAQIYIENPLLIDGYKFDFGVYVLVTSINPLRVYYYNKNTLIRLCVKKYNKTNYEDVDTYVISDACMFPWDVEALSVYYNQSYTYKEAMNAYFTKQGYQMEKVWEQVEDCINEIVLSKEYSFIHWAKFYKFKYSFFELYRFDFMLDDQLKLYLIEVNQSPNLNPSALLYRDRRMFENLLFDSFTLLGVGSYITKSSFRFGNQLEEQMICHEESLTVKPETCVNSPCNETNVLPECELCWQHLTVNERHDLHLAYRENKHRGAMKRVIPASKAMLERLGPEYLDTLSPANRKHVNWFMEMCKKDVSFC